MSGRLSRVVRTLRAAAIGCAVLLLLWAAGLAWFLHQGLSQTGEQPAATDAIVVLTGGRFRLESGVDLLEAGKARKLFITGVNQRVDREALLRILGPLPDNASCCIVLGHEADNTLGNARETAGWMRRESYRSLRLVTSWYHMPRSLLEFGRAMPAIAIVAYPVFPARPGPESWRERAHAASLVVNEYHKYVGALLRPAISPIARRFPGIVPRELDDEHAAIDVGRAAQ